MMLNVPSVPRALKLVCSNPSCMADSGFVEDPEHGDTVCTQCGRVLEEKMIDLQGEWRNFQESDQDGARAQNVDTYSEFLGTIAVPTFKPGFGKGDSTIAQTQRRVGMEGNAKNLMVGASRLSELCTRMGFPDSIKEKAKHLFKLFEETKSKVVRGGKSDPLFLAVLYFALKEEDVPRTFRELALGGQVDESEIRKFYKVLIRELPASAKKATAVNPGDLVNRFGSKLKLPQPVLELGSDIARRAMPKMEGRSPSSIAAAALFMAAKQSRVERADLEKDIAKAASISPSTVRTLFREMLTFQADLLPDHAMNLAEDEKPLD